MAFNIYMTDLDHDVMNFVQEYGSITIKQCQNMFYNKQSRGYEIARRRLSKLVANDRLKVSRDIHSNQNVYYITKKLSYHNLLSLDYLSELVKNGATIHYFEREKKWETGNYISDAFCCYSINNKIMFDLVEVIRTNMLDKNKYIKLYESGEPQNLTNLIFGQLTKTEHKTFPRLVVIDDINHRKEIEVHEKIKVVQLNFRLQYISNLFII